MANNVQQAPQTMQMIAPDLAAQQLQVQRQQQLADALRQQSMTPLDPNQMVTGAGPARAVPINKWAGLAKILQAGIAGNNQNDIDKKSLDIANQYNGRLAQVLGGGEQPAPEAQADPVSTAMASTPQNTDRMVSDGSSVPNMGPTPQALEMANQLRAQQPAPQAAQKNNFNLANLLRGQAIESIGGTHAGSAYWDGMKTPDAVKAMDLLGQDRGQMGQYATAAARKGGMMEMQPGNTVRDLTTNQLTVAPDFKSGIQGGYGPNGQPVMSRIAGSEVIPQIAGETKRAEAAGAAGYNMTKVDTPSGPVMMTAEQAAQAAGGAPNANNGGLDISKLSPQQIQQMVQQDPQAFAQGIQAFQRMQSGQQPAQVGIPLQSEAQKETEVGKAKTAVEVERARLLAAQTPEAQQGMKDANAVIGLLDQAGPLLEKATGSLVGNIRDMSAGLVGQTTPGSEAASALKVIGGSLVSKMPKMSGPQSDKDVLLYKEMAGQIGDPTVPTGNKVAAMKEIRRLNEKYIAQNQGSVANQALQNNLNPGIPGSIPLFAPPSAQSLDDLLKKYGGK